MTKLLTIDLRSSVPGPFALPEMNEFLQNVNLDRGSAEMHRWKPIHVAVEDDHDSPPGLTDLMSTVPFLVASLRFVDLMRSFNCECEYLPLIVHYHDQRLDGEYFALNALRVIDNAIDIEQSSIGYYDKEYRQAEDVSELVLNETALGDAPLTFLNEVGRFAVSDKLAQAITDAGLIGIKLVKPEEFSS